MSCEAKAKGTLQFESKEVLDELFGDLDPEDEAAAEVLEAIEGQVTRDGATLRLSIHGSFTADGNLEFQTWLEDLAEAATQGHIDTWQEDFGDSMYVRLIAGEEDEQEMPGPFPA